MPSETAHGWPYPDPGDALTDYPATAQELAQLLETVIFLLAAGVIRVPGQLEATGNLYANRGGGGEMSLRANKALYFDAGGANYLYEYADGVLATGGRIMAQGLDVHRHPYSGQRHIESGSGVVNLQAVGSGANSSGPYYYGFTDAFSAVARAGVGQIASFNNGANTDAGRSPVYIWIYELTASNIAVYLRNGSNGTIDVGFSWIAEGAD